MEWRRATAGLTPEVAGQIGRVKGRTTTAKECGVGVKLFVGLGNPGARYAGNRHNIGFMAVDRIAADHGFGPWRAKFQGEVAEGRLGGEKLLLLKPGTFMNLSGQSVRAALDFHKLTPADVTVFHDELDLAPGRVRVKQGGGHAGHNGLRSLHAHIGEAYGRVRLGIGHPGHKDRVAGYVLQDFAKADADWLEDVLRGVSDGAAALAAGDTAGFQNAVALRVAPPRSGTGEKAARQPRQAMAAPVAPAADPAPQSDTPPAPDDTRSALRRLVDRFR
jgi:peptidyl-tRNA hydrolase, PTH1 family